MKKINLFIAVLSLSAFATLAQAVVNAPVNIVYPIQGSSYNNYVNFSFSSTCPGGQYQVYWMIDNAVVGQSQYYDQFSGQFSHKLTTGWHTFTVRACNTFSQVNFYVN